MAYLTPSDSAADGVLSDQGSDVWRLTKTGEFTSVIAGEYLTLRECISAGNDGHREIDTVDGSGNWVDFTNASGVAETVPYWETVAQSVANDFRLFEAGTGVGVTTESKILHSTLSNPMTGQGLYCRKFRQTTKDQPDRFWRYQKAGWQNSAHAVSVRGLLRTIDFKSGGSSRDYLPCIVGRMDPATRKNHYSFGGYYDSTDGLVLSLVNGPYSDTTSNGLYFKDLNYGVRVKTVGGNLSFANDRWYGVRMDLLTWGTDVAIQLHYLPIADADKILDATPPWVYLGYVLHQASGATVKNPASGIEMNASLISKAPTLQGDIGIGYGAGWDSSFIDYDSLVDSFQAYRMEP